MAALRAGLTLEQFYSCTPFEVGCYVRAWIKNKEDETEERAILAYQNAFLSMYVNDPSKLPTYEEWRGVREIKVQTEEEASAAILIWARKNGLEEELEHGA